MKICAINGQMYSNRNYERARGVKQIKKQQLLQAKNEVAFKGWAGGLLGAATGAALGAILAPATGGLSLLVSYYLGAAAGGYVGHKIEGDD